MICTRSKLMPTHALRRFTLFPAYSIIKRTSCIVAFCAKEKDKVLAAGASAAS